MSDKNCLSYWFPKLQAAGLRVPKTTIIPTECELIEVLYGKTPEGFDELAKTIGAAGDAIGWPVFLRTGHTSGKHNWKNTCCLQGPDAVVQHICELVEYSNLVDLMGLPTDVWVVREILPARPPMTLPRYGDMPVVREFRCFVRDAEVLCVHPYWPRQSLVEGLPFIPVSAGESLDWESEAHRVVPPDFDQTYQTLCRLDFDEEDTVRGLASLAGRTVGGDWSVDVFDSLQGWYITDMAIARESYHWPECDKAEPEENG